jgi:hypothetical protein
VQTGWCELKSRGNRPLFACAVAGAVTEASAEVDGAGADPRLWYCH